MKPYILSLKDPNATLETVGGKGASLAKLTNAGLPVPDGFHITTAAYKHFVAENDLQGAILKALEHTDPAKPDSLAAASRTIAGLFKQATIPTPIAEAIADAYAELDGASVAVRSSATAEDLPTASFAGQQETFLNVRGHNAVHDAVKRCWASLWTARAIGYRARQEIAPDAVSLAIVVQKLVPAEAAGILFTANPLNGQRDQVVINAAWGLGEAVVGGEVTPDTFTISKDADTVLEREIAHKETMTTRTDTGTETQPVPASMQDTPTLTDQQALALAQLGTQIERLYDRPMDIEWTLAEGTFAIVQARPVTALPDPVAPPPEDWPLPNPKGKYMRASIIDLMPDPVTPLFKTLGVPALNAGIGRLVEWIGDVEYADDILEKTLFVINDYVYMTGSFSAREWWWMLRRMIPRVPRMLRIGIGHWKNEVRPAYIEIVRRWETPAPAERSSADLWHGIHEIMDAAADHLGSLMAGTMGAAAGSEMLFTNVYEKFVRQEGDPPAATLLMGYNSIPIQGEKSLYDLAMWCRERGDLASYILDTPTEALVNALDSEEPPEGLLTAADWHEFQSHLDTHLKHFGHIVYDIDFGKSLPLDHPEPILEVCKMYMRGEGGNPHERQQHAEARRKETKQIMLDRLKGLRLWAFRTTSRWAQRQAEVREDGLADIGLGYPLLRNMARELGQRFVGAGAFAEVDDIFWLEEAEIEQAITAQEHSKTLTDMREQVEARKAVWRGEKRVTPPPMLPPSDKYMGFNVEVFTAVTGEEQSGDTLKGAATSAGQVTAPARVIHGPADFDQMQAGNVLVAATTTPAWTPLFTMASAVVTDVGGPLSHGSIVAREYGIPAVMGTGVATKRIRSGQMVNVDGDAGTVTLM